MNCPNCDHERDEPVCPQCNTTIVSDPDATMDTLIQQASIPNLASLYRQGQKAGLIKPVMEYSQPA